MLRIAIAFLFVAMFAAMFGFGLIGDFAYDTAKVVFAVSLGLGVFTFLADAFSGKQIDPV